MKLDEEEVRQCRELRERGEERVAGEGGGECDVGRVVSDQ